MTALLALVSSELRQRRLLLAASALLGLFALAAPLLPSLPAGQPGEVRAATALILLGVWTPLLAVLAGATALASEMADRRVGFYLARPLSTWTIWAGKMGSAVLLPLLAGALVVLPAALAGAPVAAPLEGAGARGLAMAAGLVAAAIVALVALAHAAAIALRSRRAWLLLDLLALAVAAALIVEAVRVLRRAFVPAAIAAGSIALTALALLALLAAGALAVQRGRGDLASAHRILSLALWPPLLAGALGFVFFARWVVGAPIESLKDPRVWAPPGASRWVTVTGRAEGRFNYRPLFLLDAASGRSVKVAFPAWPAFAADGSRAVWLTAVKNGPELRRLDLTRPGARPEETRIALHSFPECLEVSPRGRRVAVLHAGRLLAYTLADGRLVASASLDPALTGQRLRFLAEDLLRVVGQRRGEPLPALEVWDLTLPGGKLLRRSSIEAPQQLLLSSMSPAGARALLRTIPADPRESGALQLHALPSGELVSGFGRALRDGTFLPDGKLVLAGPTAGGWLLHVASADGRHERTFRFPGAARLHLGGQPTPGTLVVVRASGRARERPTSYQLDLASGEVRRIGEGLWPVGDARTVGTSARLFRTKEGLVEIDDRGARRVVLSFRG